MRFAWFLALAAVACAAHHPSETPPRPGAAGALDAAPSSERRAVVISIVGTNDLHGHIERLPTFAGYLGRLRELRASDGGVVLVDAGDMFQGTLESNLSEGAAVITAMNWLGYSAAALGNHDFDYGPLGDVEPSTGSSVDRQGALRARLAEARFPVLAANLTQSGNAPRWANLSSEPLLLDVAGVKVGIVGGLTEETPAIVMRAYFEGLEVGPLAPALERQARRARQLGARIVVAAVHAGGKCERLDDPHDITSCDGSQEIVRVARELEPRLVDVIVAGHTHKGVAHFFGGIAVVEGFALGSAFSRVDVGVPADERAPLKLSVLPPQRVCATEDGECSYEGAPVHPSAELATLLAPYVERAATRRAEKLGVQVTTDVTPAFDKESALGNLVADLLLAATPGADVSLVNGGGLRSAFRSGALTYGALHEALPFDNRVAVLRLTGEQLALVLRAHLEQGGHGILSLGGARIDARCSEKGLDVRLLRATTGKPIGGAQQVMVVTSDYLATGGDQLFDILKPGAPEPDVRSEMLRDAVAGQLRARTTPLSGSDPTLLDPKRPRMRLPSPRPVSCAPTAGK